MIELIPGADYCVRYISLPKHVGGVTVIMDDGFFCIYINDILPIEKQWHSLLHELAHCYDDHFYADNLSNDEKELIADAIADSSDFEIMVRKTLIFPA